MLKVSTEIGSRLCGSKAAMTSDSVVSDLMPPLWEEVLWPFLNAWDSVRLRTTSTQWNVPGRYGPNGELFFFLLETAAGPQGVGSVWVPASQSKQSMIEENSGRSENGSSVSSAVRMKTPWVMTRCYHQATWIRRHDCPFPARLGGGKGSPGLSYSIRCAMPRIVRS